jgi:ATP-dependent helicase HrpB
VEAVRAAGAAVVVAPPGAGKTTRIPPALAGDGPLILLQPRRVAARALARRIAAEQGFTLGEEVGWQVRFERRFTARTRLLVATEGILTARLQADPLLAGFRTVVLDEFHERSLHGDLALALARQAARARGDLRLVVMSATLEAGRVADFLGGCPVVDVPGRLHELRVAYRPGTAVVEGVREAAASSSRHILCFLPGAPEIRRAAGELGGWAVRAGLDLFPLHGRLSAEAQDTALAPSPRRKLILATNVAETSLTVEDVDAVVDTGTHKVLRYDAERGLDRLVSERISADSAEQRAGRAGRTAPGRVFRLWDERDRLRPRREPEIARVDLLGPLLEVLAWGGDAASFEWFEAPPPAAVEAALRLLEALGAVEAGRLTAVGEAMHRFPLHPRLARVLVATGGGRRAALVCALLAERLPSRPAETATDSDVLSLADHVRELPAGVRQAAAEIERLARSALPRIPPRDDDLSLRRALLHGFPDRLAQRRAPRSPRLLLSSGPGAVLGPESGVEEGELLLALEVSWSGPEAVVRVASRVEPEWALPDRREEATEWDAERQEARGVVRECRGAITLAVRPARPDAARAAALVAEAWLARGPDAEEEQLLRRLAFAGVAVEGAALALRACVGLTRLADVRLVSVLDERERRALDRHAPADLPVPSGRRVRLDYRADGTVAAAVKLQELFGLAESPRLGPRGEAVLFELLAPSGRPVQATRDLRSFWTRTYPAVRRELRGRYPKHPWPEDPWTAPPTARAKGRGPGRAGSAG